MRRRRKRTLTKELCNWQAERREPALLPNDSKLLSLRPRLLQDNARSLRVRIEKLDGEQKKTLHNVMTSSSINDGFPGVILKDDQLKTPQFLNFTLVCGDDSDIKSFLNKLKSSRLYDPKTASGRRSKMILGDCCSRCPVCPVKTTCNAISMNLTGADKQYIDTCWHWATHKDAKSGVQY